MHQAKNLWPSLSRETAWLLPGNLCKGFPGGPVEKNPPAMQKTQQVWVWSLSYIDPLEEEMATHSSILAWKISWTEEPGGLQSMGSQRVGHDWATSLTHSQINCYENVCTDFCMNIKLHFCEINLRSKISGLPGHFMFSFIRNCQVVFQNGLYYFHSH